MKPGSRRLPQVWSIAYNTRKKKFRLLEKDKSSLSSTLAFSKRHLKDEIFLQEDH